MISKDKITEIFCIAASLFRCNDDVLKISSVR